MHAGGRQLWIGLSIAMCSCGMPAGCGPAPMQLYVSRSGNDAWSGRLADVRFDGADGPFATLERARDEVRKAKAAGELEAGACVEIRGGLYFRDKPLALTEEDGGTAAGPIVWRAYRDEAVRLNAGMQVKGFSPVTDAAVLGRLDEAARPHVLQADLKAAGLSDFGEVARAGQRCEVYFQDRRMTLARWPNEGYTKTGETKGGDEFKSHGIAGDKIGKFTYQGDRPERWKAEPEIWLQGFWFWDWADAYQKVKSIDTEGKVIELVAPYHGYGYRKGQRYYVLNLLSELDAPSEWHLDRQAGVLYFWPPAPLESSMVFVSRVNRLVELKGASHVTLSRLTFECNREHAVHIAGGSHVRLEGCTLRNVGANGVVIDGGTDHTVIGCDLYNLGHCGVTIKSGDRKTLTPGRCLVENNHFHDFSQMAFTYQPAVNMLGVGHRIAHNLIHDAPHMAIYAGTNECIVEYNEIHHVVMTTDDAGAFYMGRDWTQRGNIVRYNYFHDIGDFKSHVGTMSVYLDDWASGTMVYGNLCVRGGRAVLIGGGRNNTVENNVFVDCTPAVHVDSRGLGWAKSYFDSTDNTLVERLKAMNYRQPPYSERYPELLTLYDDEPALAKYNVIARNICVGGRWLDLLDGLTDKVVSIKDNLVNEDPHFVDAAHGDYRLKDDSPALKLGFKPLPIDKMGLYDSPLRASPVNAAGKNPRE